MRRSEAALICVRPKRRSDDARSVSGMAAFNFRRPSTRLIVEGRIADDPTGEQADMYECCDLRGVYVRALGQPKDQEGVGCR